MSDCYSPSIAEINMKTEKIEYSDDNKILEGFLAFDENKEGKRPGILICHDWSGRNEFAENKAKQLAELGYVGFAIDMFGKGVLGKTLEEKQALITPFMQDRKKLLQRIKVAFEKIKQLPQVDSNYLCAIGFCFGGLCALDLARDGTDLKGVVSFHGLLNPPDSNTQKIKAKILALHGHDDPMVKPEQVLSFENEMTSAGADWQLHVYGNTKHAFTNPAAHDNQLGTVYNELAAKRSWSAMQSFFKEIF